MPFCFLVPRRSRALATESVVPAFRHQGDGGVVVSGMLRRMRTSIAGNSGSGNPPSPCTQDLRRVTVHTFRFHRFTDMLLSPLPFGARLVSCPKRSHALDLLPVPGNLIIATTAHRKESGKGPGPDCSGTPTPPRRTETCTFPCIRLSKSHYRLCLAWKIRQIGKLEAIILAPVDLPMTV